MVMWVINYSAIEVRNILEAILKEVLILKHYSATNSMNLYLKCHKYKQDYRIHSYKYIISGKIINILYKFVTLKNMH